MPHARSSLLLSWICVFLLLAGCGGGSSTPDLGEWSLKTNGMILTEELRVSDTETFYFGSIVGLDVTNEGRIVVADRQAKNLKLLRSDGTLLDTLGRAGSGPGEFRQLIDVQVARGDSLYAFDPRQSRLTVFAPGAPYRLSRTVRLPRKSGFPIRFQILDEAVVAEFASTSSPEEGVARPSPRTWRVVRESGALGDTLLQTPGYRMLTTETSGGGFRMQTIPLSPRTAIAWGPDGRLYHGWTDSLHVEVRSLNGSSTDIASVPTDPVPLTETARDSVLKDTDSDIRSKLGPALPDTKPAFTDLIVADDGRIWVKRPKKKAEPDTTPWWILNSESKKIQEVRLPSEVELEVVQNGRAYGTTETEMGAPAVVRYRIDSSS